MRRGGDRLKFLVLHVFLRPDKGEVADVDPAAEREIDVGDGEQHERDEEREGKDLERHEGVAFAEPNIEAEAMVRNPPMMRTAQKMVGRW